MVLDLTDLDNRGQKAVEVASTYIQVLIGLASGIITAALVFYSDISKLTNFDLPLLKLALVSFGISIGVGLLGLGGLVSSTANSNIPKPTDSKTVRPFVIAQFVSFFIGIFLVISAIP